MKKGNVVVESRLMSNNQSDGVNHGGVPEFDKASPFALLSITPLFFIDHEILKQNYRLLQETLHPDRYPLQSKEAEIACLMASAINQAYAVLQDPLQRAKALLLLKGGAIPGASGQTICDPRFMDEALDLKELLEAAQTAESCAQLISALSEKERQVGELFQDAFLANDLTAMSDAYIRLSFVVKTKNDAACALTEMGIGDYAPSA